MKVCIAEKPSVAREIAQVIGANQKKNGFFEGNGYQVTWTFGHFCTLYAPEDYFPHWKRWDLNTLPMLPEKFETRVMDDEGVKKQMKVIQDLCHSAQEVINCGDAGQEGELIQRWVLKAANYQGPVQRLWISSLTKEAIEQGFKELKPAEQFDLLYHAGSSRAIGDWLLGMNATRLFTLKFGGNKQVLSIGRVQTPTLAMLVQRYEEIQNFTSTPYWEIQTLYRDTPFRYTEGRFEDQTEGEKVMDKIKGKDLHIVSTEGKDGKEYAPKLFDLTGLQVYSNTHFNLSAENTLKTVQSLYEKKVVTYPRVDTTFLPNDMYPKVPKILQGLHDYQSLTEPILGKKIRKSTKVFNDKKVTDHHAIIPTGENGHLNAVEQQVYDIIVRRFIAVFYPDCKVAKTEVKAECEEIPFVAKGKEIIDAGWRVVFESQQDENKKEEDDGLLPTFEEGEKGPHEPDFVEKWTKAPAQYTEASLLRAMETAGKQVDDDELRDLMKENGIGRPSTRANIIETLFKRKYAERNKKQVLPTPLGIQLIHTIQNDLLKSAELTGQWEKKLKEIESGEFPASHFIHHMKEMVKNLVVEVRMEADKPLQNPENEIKKVQTDGLIGSPCPKCKKGQLIKGKTSFGCSAFQSGCNFLLPFEIKGKKISEKQWLGVLKKGKSNVLKGFVKDGQKLEGRLILSDNFEIDVQTKAAAPSKHCPKCKKGQIIAGKTALGCDQWKSGCDFRLDFSTLEQEGLDFQSNPDAVYTFIHKQ